MTPGCTAPRHDVAARAVSMLLLVALAVLCGPREARAQDDVLEPPAPLTGEQAPSDLPSRETLQAALDLLEGTDPELAGDELERALTLRRQALLDWDRWSAARTQLEEHVRAREAVPDELATARAQLDAFDPTPVEVPADLALEQLAAQTETAAATRDRAEASVTTQRERMEQRERRRAELPERVAEAEGRLLELADLPPLAEGLPTRLREADVDARAAERAKAEAELASLRAELEHLTSALELDRLREELLERASELARTNALALQTTLDRRQIEQREQAAERASAQARTADPLLEPLADEVLLLAEELSQLTARATQVAREREQVEASLTTTAKRFDSTRQKLEIAGLSNLNGMLLRQERSRLPNVAAVRASLVAHQEAIALRQIRLQEVEDTIDLLESSPLEVQAQEFVAARIAEAGGGYEEPQRAELGTEARGFLEDELETLRELADELERLVSELERLELAEQRYVDLTGTYSQFIQERVLWVRSAAPLWRWEYEERRSTRDRLLAGRTTEIDLEPKNEVRDLVDASGWLLSPVAWSEALATLGEDAGRAPVAWVLVLLLVAGLALARRPLRKHMSAMVASGASQVSTRYQPLAAATGITVLLALPGPLLVWFLGWRLGEAVSTRELPVALADVLPAVGALLFGLELIRRSFRPDGLFVGHLGWAADAARRVWTTLILFTWPFVLAHLAVGLLDAHPDETYASTLGRLVFIPQMLWLAFCAQRLARRPAERRDGDDADSSAVERPFLRRLAVAWTWTALLAPLFLVALSALGYVFTAQQLLALLLQTLALVAGLYLGQAIALRLVEITRRRVAVQRLRRAMLRRRETDDDGQEDDAEAFEEPPTNLSEVSSQVRQLLSSAIGLAGLLGVYLIWIDVIPALGIFREVKLWTVTSTESILPLAGEEPSGDEVMRDVRVPVTLADLLLAIFVGIAALFAARRVPTLLDILIFERLRIGSGERYAYTTVLRYLITLVGVVVALSLVRVGWTQVQFLAAAISVGLGFGLQEIFANFVSGLILLFERPIRLGDWVTIGDKTGQVTKIRIRATTIQDRERKELIVPNKEFVTGQLVNWTLTDSVTRASVLVGIAYGSDVDLARDTLLEVARSTKQVLHHPAPRALFLGFGDSSLEFRLDVFIPEQQPMFEIISELHFGIDRAFRAKHIEIAFPQRDLHVRTAPALETLLEERRKGADYRLESSGGAPETA